MSFSFIDESNIKDFVHDSDEYMKPFYRDLAEYERLGRGKPGRIPKGKPRVTDGTLAGSRRETAKRIIQQLPTGKVTIKKLPELEPYVNAILTDEILPNANSGGTPYSKSKRVIKDAYTGGAAAGLVFYNRRGDWFGADFKRIYIKDVGFEKGKISEFDSNVMKLTCWYTKMDIKAIIHYQKMLKKSAKERGEVYKSDWNLKLLSDLLDEGLEEKDREHMSEAERDHDKGPKGYFKLEHVYQIGTGAKFYTYAPKLDKVIKTCANKDPRGIIPIHLMIPEEDDASPLGDPLISISAGKQNLLDFDMQMYQYSRGLLLSPPVKLWGNVPASQVKLVPDSVINMGGNKTSGNDIEVLDINNSAISDYRNNSSYIKTQIYNEQGSSGGDSSISASVGAVGYSKTDSGVKDQAAKLGISDNDLRKSYESWFGRITETMLNLHFAESQGQKELDIELSTIKRLKLDPEDLTMDYDQDFGKIKFSVDASTSEASDSKQENEQLIGLLEITRDNGGLRPDRQMSIVNQIIQNSGVDDAENLQYTDEEIEQAKQLALNPPVVEPQVVDPNQVTAEPAMQQPPMTVDPQSQNMPMPVEPAAPALEEDEAQTIQLLSERGYAPDQIADAIVMLRADYSDEDIIATLGAPGGMQ